MDGEHAWICGIGMVTPVGGHAAQTAASVRAGISVYEESAFFNQRFEPMTLALIPDDILPPLNDELTGTDKLSSRQVRMLKLADLALTEALEALPEDHQQLLPLCFVGPEPTPGRPEVVDGRFLRLFEKQTETDFNHGNSKLYTTGRAGCMQALESALQILAAEEHDYVILGGVDSFLDLHLLATLDMDNRVLANGVMDGFAPGEGAGFLLLCSDKARALRSDRPSLKIYAPGIAEEAGHRNSEEPYMGDGLANAVTIALEALDNPPVRTVLSSMNGENFGAKEWGVAFTRNSSSIDSEVRFELPAECFGDTGAAVMPILVGLAAMGLQAGYMPGPVLSLCSSEGPQRGAVCVNIEP